MYRISPNRRKVRHRKRLWLVFILFFLLIATAAFGYAWVSKPRAPVITQSKPVITKVAYAGKLKHYDEGDFTIDIPASWTAVPRPPYTYNSFSWETVEKNDGQQIEIYEDTIPTQFAVNKAVIISGATDHVDLKGTVSDNCITFTKPVSTTPNVTSVPARWLDTDFICNRGTTTRDVIGTSSADGPNIVKLQSTSGTPHSFFFTYSDNDIAADYTAFYNALTSFAMK